MKNKKQLFSSRFARNQLDFISIYRELKALSPPVGIYIEDINLNTHDTNSESILGIMAIVAQGESEQNSALITWSVIERFKRVIPMIPTHNLLGYTKDQYGRVVIDEIEAKIPIILLLQSNFSSYPLNLASNWKYETHSIIFRLNKSSCCVIL